MRVLRGFLRKRLCTQTKFLQFSFEYFYLPFGGKLDGKNRWVKMTVAIPWHVAELLYTSKLPSKTGVLDLTVRMSNGSDKLGLSGQETVKQIKENPYLQYCKGLEREQHEAAIDRSLRTHFRKRFMNTVFATLHKLR